MGVTMTVLRIVGAMLVLACGLLFALTNAHPHDADAIAGYAEQLFAFGSVRYVHSLDSDRIVEQQTLFDRVAQGDGLDATESCAYRTTYWLVLQDYTNRFQLADDDLYMATDFGSTHINNCGGLGITGHHDLHDVSAKRNFDQLVDHLDALEEGAGFIDTILRVNEVHKNLVDLMVHMAPATHSIGVMSPEFAQEGRLAAPFNRMQSGFKAAQFAPLNSPAYWQGVRDALAAYTEIVATVQNATTRHSTGLQRRIAGRWLSLQTVAPRLKLTDCVRPRAGQLAAAC